MGAILVAGGITITYLAVTAWPVGFLAATPGLLMIGYGGNLLFGCAFYDDVDIKPGPLGFPTITRSNS